MHKSTNLIGALRLLAKHGGARENAAMEAGSSPAMAALCKSIGATVSGSSSDMRTAYAEILELASRFSLIGKIQSISPFRSLPFETSFLRQAAGVTAGFIAEGAPIPAGSADFSATRLSRRKVAAILPVTKEITASIEGEKTLSRDLIRAIAAAESSVFFSSGSVDADAPAGIFNGVSPGTGSASIANDVAALLDLFAGDLSNAVMLASPRSAAHLASVYETAGVRGGEILGVPLVTHYSIPDNQIGLVEPSRIALADGGVEIDLSGEAIVQTFDSSGDIEESISFFQQNLVGFRAIRYLNWLPGTGSVAWVSGTTWGAAP